MTLTMMDSTGSFGSLLHQIAHDRFPEVPLSLVIGSGALTFVLASALTYFILRKSSSSKAAHAEPRNPVKSVLIDKERYPGGSVTVYFGTQTGTAESFAKQLQRDGPLHGFFVNVVDLENIQCLSDFVERDDGEEGKTHRAVFLCATYGEGEPTDNSQHVATMLLEAADMPSIIFDPSSPIPEDVGTPNRSLLGNKLEYCVFGLGNIQYEHYNMMSRFFHVSLSRIGGVPILPTVGLGNDDADLESDFESWKDTMLWPTMKSKYFKESSSKNFRSLDLDGKQDWPETPYSVRFLGEASIVDSVSPSSVPLDQVHPSSRPYFTAVDCPVTCVRELRNVAENPVTPNKGTTNGISKNTANDTMSTVHVELDVSHVQRVLNYHTADNLGVLPVNDPDIVSSVADCLEYDLDAVFTVDAAADDSHEWGGELFPTPISVRDFLSRYCDLTGPPRRSDLKLWSCFATDPIDRKALERMAGKDGKAEYREKILNTYSGLVDILRRCASLRIPLEHFINVCPRMQTRFYTISSSSAAFPTSIHLTVAVSSARREDGTMFNGVASTHLARCISGQSSVRVYNRPSTFRLPPDASTPIILIGPGTGIAPMRALLQERSHQKNASPPNGAVGPSILYFGCKHPKYDFLYEDELRAFQEEGTLHELYVAFSREHHDRKVYVQHLLQKNSQATWSLIHERSAYIYVCGGVKMGNDVHEAFKIIVQTEGNQTEQQALAYLKRLAESGRYVQELWT
jgi:NADPH-ferrihemoprotein reductase